jgi:pyrophosphatase PpaX
MKRLAILFDLDGTLIDSITLLLNSMEAAYQGRTLRPSQSEWTAGIGIPLRTQLARWSASEEDTEQLIARYRDYQSLHLEALTVAYPGVPDVLQWIRSRGHAIALVTSKGLGMTERSLTHVGLADAFDLLVTAESTERHKPLPDPVWLALEKLDVERDNALFVGDSTHDMHAGRAAGVRTAAATWGPFSRLELEPAQPTYWLNTMHDLVPIVESLHAHPAGAE